MRFAYVADRWERRRDGTVDYLERPHGRELRHKLAPQKKLLVLSVSAGSGHTRAAEAIRAYANAHGAGATATHLDVMDFASAGLRRIYTRFYIVLVSRYPLLWGCLYRLTDRARADGMLQRLRRCIERWNAGRLIKEIASTRPDAIICTHFLPAEMLSRMIRNGRLACPVWVQVTDFDLHRMWVHEGMAGYFVASEEVAFRLRAQGIAPQSIHITGIPVMPAFGQALDRAECAREFGLDSQRLTFLLMGGGAGLGSLDRIAARLLALDGDFQLIVLAGRNACALTALQMLAVRYPRRLAAHGFTHQVERLMACADLVITKPGGLTTSECLAMGLPMIVHAPIPGQEERNADFLLEQGAALKAFDAVTLEYRIRLVLDHPATLADLRARAKALGRPVAARSVVETVLEKICA